MQYWLVNFGYTIDVETDAFYDIGLLDNTHVYGGDAFIIYGEFIGSKKRQFIELRSQ